MHEAAGGRSCFCCDGATPRSALAFAAFVAVGWSTWLVPNAVFVEQGMLVQMLPEAALAPTFATLVMQIGFVAALLRTLLRGRLRCCRADASWMLVVMVATLASSVCIAWVWPVRWCSAASASTDASANTLPQCLSMLLWVTLLLAGSASSLSQVTMWPWAARFTPMATVALMTGETVSGLLPSLLGLVQTNVSGGMPFSEFMLGMSVCAAASLLAFAVLAVTRAASPFAVHGGGEACAGALPVLAPGKSARRDVASAPVAVLGARTALVPAGEDAGDGGGQRSRYEAIRDASAVTARRRAGSCVCCARLCCPSTAADPMRVGGVILATVFVNQFAANGVLFSSAAYACTPYGDGWPTAYTWFSILSAGLSPLASLAGGVIQRRLQSSVLLAGVMSVAGMLITAALTLAGLSKQPVFGASGLSVMVAASVAASFVLAFARTQLFTAVHYVGRRAAAVERAAGAVGELGGDEPLSSAPPRPVGVSSGSVTAPHAVADDRDGDGDDDGDGDVRLFRLVGFIGQLGAVLGALLMFGVTTFTRAFVV